MKKEEGNTQNNRSEGGLRFSLMIVLVAIWVHPALANPPGQSIPPSSGQTSPPEAAPSPPARTIDGVTTRLETRIDRMAKAAEVVIRASAYFRKAESLAQAGKLEPAREQLQQALSVVAEAGREPDSEPYIEEPLVRQFVHQVEQKLAVLAGEMPAADSLMTLSKPDMDDPRVQEAEKSIRAAIHRFQTGRRSLTLTSLARLQPIRAAIERVFHQVGVPAELMAVGLVESAYNPLALSSKGAKGIWQFVELTGRRYGLAARAGKDQREDLLGSTRAAARYLKDLYQRFGDWPLALAAYNAGEGRIEQAVKSTGIRDFWKLVRRGALPDETVEYVPSVLAAMRILKDPARYGFPHGSRAANQVNERKKEL